MRMTKKILALFLAMVLCLSLMPFGAFATEESVDVTEEDTASEPYEPAEEELMAQEEAVPELDEPNEEAGENVLTPVPVEASVGEPIESGEVPAINTEEFSEVEEANEIEDTNETEEVLVTESETELPIVDDEASFFPSLDGNTYEVVPGIIKKDKISANTSSTTHNYSSDWQYWCQGASKYRDVRAYGCHFVAQSKLLIELGAAKSSVNSFNPDYYYEWGLSKEYWGTDLNEKSIGAAAIGYAAKNDIVMTKGYKTLSGSNSASDVKLIMDYIEKGYYIILDCSAHEAYVGRAASLAAETPIILDSWNSYSFNPDSCCTYSGYTLNYYTGFYYYDTAPTISYKAKATGGMCISPTEEGFKLTFDVSDNVGVTDFYVNVWEYGKTEAEAVKIPGTLSKNATVATVVVNCTSQFGGFKGPYYAKGYAYDASGNHAEADTSDTPFSLYVSKADPEYIATYKVLEDNTPVRIAPYSKLNNKDTKVGVLSKGTKVSAVGVYVNDYGNTWLQLEDGTWIYYDNVKYASVWTSLSKNLSKFLNPYPQE